MSGGMKGQGRVGRLGRDMQGEDWDCKGEVNYS